MLMYREHQKLKAISFESVWGQFKFQIQAGSEGLRGEIIVGIIDGSGSIDSFRIKIKKSYNVSNLLLSKP